MERALASHPFGPYTLQGAIAAVHAEAESAVATDCRQIAILYDRLLHLQRSPVIELNRAVAIAMRDGPELGLSLIDELLARGELENYHRHTPLGLICAAGLVGFLRGSVLL